MMILWIKDRVLSFFVCVNALGKGLMIATYPIGSMPDVELWV